MIDHVLDPDIVCVLRGGQSVLEARIIHQLLPLEMVIVERRIGHDEIRPHGRVDVVYVSVSVEFAEVGIDAADSKVHLRHFPCGGVEFLTVNGNVIDASAVLLDELSGLDEHTARAAAGIYKNANFDTNRKSLIRHISAEKGLK